MKIKFLIKKLREGKLLMKDQKILLILIVRFLKIIILIIVYKIKKYLK